MRINPVISTRTHFTNDAIPLGNHPMEMAGLRRVAPDHDGVGVACSNAATLH
jgi:hypothetical protein